MTSERKKSIIILAMTLLVGILLGLLTPGFFNKWEKRGKYGNRGHDQDYNHKKEWFIGTMNRILKPDSLQAKKIQPVTEWAAIEIDSLESTANQKMNSILDSVKNQLKPILTPEQQNRLDKFDAHAKKTWMKGSKRRH
jgi:hypothetical protein